MFFFKTLLSKYNVKNYGFVDFDMDRIVFETRKNYLLNNDFKSIIIMAFPYFNEIAVGGNISLYASVNDYHIVIKKMLDPMLFELTEHYKEKFLLFIDSSPINEVKTAYEAGLGVIGKHSMLITKDYGSFVFLASIVTTLPLPKSEFYGGECISCNLCIKKCPSNAIFEDKKINKEICLSNVSQRKGELSQKEKELLRQNNIAWGCDICQTVCPHNRNIKSTYINGFLNDVVKNLDEESVHLYKSRAFGFRGKSVLLRNIENLKNY